MKYAREWIVEIQDVSGLVAEQRRHALEGDVEELVTPKERAYPVADATTAHVLGLAPGRATAGG